MSSSSLGIQSLGNFVQSEALVLWELIRKHWVALGVVIVATLILIMMKTPILYQWHLTFGSRNINSFAYYGLVPLLCLTMFTRKNPLKLGLGLGNYRFWVPAVIIYLLITLPCVYIGSQLFGGLNSYYNSSGLDFIDYSLGIALYMLGWEYFYRGFLIQGLKDSMKEGAILLQMIPFTLLHFGKPEIEIASCIIAGLVWGYIAYRGDSFWPAFIMHTAVNVTLIAAATGLI